MAAPTGPAARLLTVLHFLLLITATCHANPALSLNGGLEVHANEYVNASAETDANTDARSRDLDDHVDAIVALDHHNELVRRLQDERPVAIRKMSSDPGEKFYMHYWMFADDIVADTETNQTQLRSLETAFLIHSAEEENNKDDHNGGSAALLGFLSPRRLPLFAKRGYQCPTDTYACTSINRPNSCCSTGSTCQLVTDTGLGDVGCCPDGDTCGGTLSSCTSDYSSCNGGGCCLPGFECMGVGCVQTDTSTVVVAPSTTQTTSTTVQDSTVTVTSTVWTTPLAGSPIVHTSTYVTVIIPTVVTSPTTEISTTTTIMTTTATPSSASSSTQQASQPVLPTSLASSSSSSSSSSSPSSSSSSSLTYSLSGCPTGFYACSAYYGGGCCQTDRDCHSTSCPARASTTVVGTDSVTVVAQTGSGITTVGSLLTGSCASYWTTCSADVSGGCCPSGYACGVSACTATQTAGQTDTVAKEAPSSSTVLGRSIDWIVLGVGLCISSLAFGSALWL